MKVLYVEDDACDAELVQRALGRPAGAFEVRWAKTLLEALPQLAEVDLVLTDLRLPDGSGLELLAVIRERRLGVAVVLLTGAGDESTVMAAIKGGVDDYVAKRSDYLDRLAGVLTAAVERCRSHTQLRLRPLRVVYAEHNAADADLTLRHVARHAPHILIEIVPNAETVLALLARSPDRFDVVLLDYRLQGLDALNALKELRETLHSDVPVVLVTGQGNEEIATQALRLGVTDYLIKHVGYLYQLTAVLEGAHQRRQLARDQAALQASETHFRVLFEQAADAIGLLDPHRTFLDLNASGVQLIGWTREELLGRPVSELLVTAEPVRFAAVRASVQADAIVTEEWRLRRKDGQILEVEATIRRLPDGRWLVVGRDVTLRKQTERALQRQQEALLRLNEAAALPVFDPQQVLLQTLLIATRHLQMEYGIVCHALGAQGQIEAQVTPAGAQTVNHAFALEGSYCQLPLQADELVARPQVTVPLVSPCLQGAMASAYLGVPLQVDGAIFGTLNFLSTQPRPAGFDTADLDFVRLLARTVAATLQRREALARLRESESRLSGIIDTAMDAIISVNEDQCILVFNDAAEKVFHCTAGAALGRALQQFLPDALLAEQIAHLREDGAQTRTLGQPCRLQGRRADGGEFPCEASISQVEVNGHRLLTVILRDLTERTQAEAERKALETQMLRAQRLESVGRLAGGIAHDLNNILSPVLLGTSLLREYVSNPLALDTLQAMEQSTRRGAAIIRQLLTFSRGSGGERVVVNFGRVVRDMAAIITETFPKKIVLRCEQPADLWPVTGDPTQLHQVVMNLCVNARDAMPEGGSLTLTTQNLLFTAEQAAALVGAQPGPYLLLTVADTGTGIAPEHLEKIYDPFFTTKAVGQGTGLGLSTVLGIVKSHQGVVQVDSTLGAGTSFHIYLPASPDGTWQEATPETTVLPMGNGETILVVDDEVPVRMVTRRLLERSGYRVVEAGDGREGLERYRQHRAVIAVVITDLIMPEFDGPAFIRQLREYDTRLPVIAASGNPAESNLTPDERASIQALLGKPYEFAGLLRLLHQLLHP